MSKSLLVMTLLLATGCATGKAFGPIDPYALPEAYDKSPTAIEYQIASVGAAQLDALYRSEFDLNNARRMRKVGNRITRYCERPSLTYQYIVLDTDQMQASSLPDGTICITRGLLQLVDSDDEIAAILSHEIAHVTHRHVLRTYERTYSSGRLIGSAIAATATSLIGMPALGIELVQGAGEHRYAPKQELQADVTALRYMRRSGYDPNTYPAVLIKMINYIYKHPETAPAKTTKLKTHPNDSERIRFIRQAIERVSTEEKVLYKPEDFKE